MIIKFIKFIEFTKFTKFKKRDKFFDTKSKDFTRCFDLLRVEFRAFFVFSFFVIQFSRWLKREKTERLYKKFFFFKFKRQTQAKKKIKKKRFENVMRAINENDFVNLSQFSLQKSAFKNDTTTIIIKNKTFYCDSKNLSN